MRAYPDGRSAGRGVIAGVLASAVAVGVGELVAGITGPAGSPLVATGQLLIDMTPPAVKNFAIRTFGAHDKLVLVSGILAVLAAFAAVLGALAMRRLWQGLAGLAVFAVIGLVAAATRPAASAADVAPTLAAAAAGVIALLALVRAARADGKLTGPPRAAAAGEELPDGTTGVVPGPAPSLAAQAPPARSAPPPREISWSGEGSAARPQQGRRRFLAASAAAAGGLAGRLLAERSNVAQAQRSLRLPRPARPAPPLPAGADLRIPGLSSFITANGPFYRVDTAIILPQVTPAGWQLRIHGMVRREISLSFAELLRRPLIEDYITLCCVSNPVAGPYIGNALWLGASLASLLREAGIRAGASQLLCTSVDGFTLGTPVQTAMDGRDALLAVAMNGTALPVAHGFPARLVIPGLYGYVSACKWITGIEVTTYAAATAYWAQRGWSARAPVKTESRIDVPNGQAPVRPGRTAVAGVAWAQHKGIDAVEVRVDNGLWQQARLAAVPGIDTWRQWVWDWDATTGRHLIQARATDKTGYTQTAVQSPPEPNGATGYPSIAVTVG